MIIKRLSNKIIIIIIILIIICLFFYKFNLFDLIKDKCIFLTENYGALGLLIVSIILELFIHPFSSGFFVIIAVIGGINFFLATFIASSGSMIGGILYYFMGKTDKKIINVNKYNELKSKFLKFLYKNNILLLFLLIVTTGPFTVLSLIAGNLRIKFSKYLLISFIGRFLKLFFYALFGLGFIKVKTFFY